MNFCLHTRFGLNDNKGSHRGLFPCKYISLGDDSCGVAVPRPIAVPTSGQGHHIATSSVEAGWRASLGDQGAVEQDPAAAAMVVENVALDVENLVAEQQLLVTMVANPSKTNATTSAVQIDLHRPPPYNTALRGRLTWCEPVRQELDAELEARVAVQKAAAKLAADELGRCTAELAAARGKVAELTAARLLLQAEASAVTAAARDYKEEGARDGVSVEDEDFEGTRARLDQGRKDARNLYQSMLASPPRSAPPPPPSPPNQHTPTASTRISACTSACNTRPHHAKVLQMRLIR